MNTSMLLTPVSEEFELADLGDKRLTARACLIADGVSRAP
jgi:hypothetical protein